MEYFENNFTAPPNSDNIVMWRFLRNRRLILRLRRPTIFRALTYWAHRAVILAIAWFPCLQSSRWSLCHLSQSSISAYETNTSRWSHKFHPHLCTNWCLQIFVLSTYISGMEHSVCWSPSQVFVVCKRVSWFGRLSHDTPAVKGGAHCWIFTEELKNWRDLKLLAVKLFSK